MYECDWHASVSLFFVEIQLLSVCGGNSFFPGGVKRFFRTKKLKMERIFVRSPKKYSISKMYSSWLSFSLLLSSHGWKVLWGKWCLRLQLGDYRVTTNENETQTFFIISSSSFPRYLIVIVLDFIKIYWDRVDIICCRLFDCISRVWRKFFFLFRKLLHICEKRQFGVSKWVFSWVRVKFSPLKEHEVLSEAELLRKLYFFYPIMGLKSSKDKIFVQRYQIPFLHWNGLARIAIKEKLSCRYMYIFHMIRK